MPHTLSRAPLRVIIRRVDFLGDIVLSLPVISAIFANFPAAEKVLMVKPEHRFLFDKIVDRFVEPVSITDFPNVARAFDRAYNIDYFLSDELAAALAKRIAAGRFDLEGVLHVTAGHGHKRQHVVRHFYDGLRVLGLQVPRSAVPRIPLGSEEKRGADSWFTDADRGKDRRLRIGIHVGSRNPVKCWPLDRYRQLADWLIKAYDAKLYFIGSGDERSVIEEVTSKLPTASVTVVHDQALPTLATILSRLDLTIGNDSGVSHLAAAVGTPTVSIFGPTSPITWRPAGNRSIVVVDPKYADRNPIDDPNVHPTLHGISVEHARYGVLLTIQLHIRRKRFSVLDLLSPAPNIQVRRTTDGVILRRGTNGPACLISGGWANVKRILTTIQRTGSYAQTLARHPDAAPLMDILILHRILLQGNESKQTRR